MPQPMPRARSAEASRRPRRAAIADRSRSRCGASGRRRRAVRLRDAQRVGRGRARGGATACRVVRRQRRPLMPPRRREAWARAVRRWLGAAARCDRRRVGSGVGGGHSGSWARSWRLAALLAPVLGVVRGDAAGRERRRRRRARRGGCHLGRGRRAFRATSPRTSPPATARRSPACEIDGPVASVTAQSSTFGFTVDAPRSRRTTRMARMTRGPLSSDSVGDQSKTVSMNRYETAEGRSSPGESNSSPAARA